MKLFPCFLVAMVIAGVQAKCPSNYELIGGKCLKFLNGITLNYVDARGLCKIYGGDLAIVDDCSLLGDIIDHIFSAGISSVSYWVGANDIEEEGSFKWVDGSSVDMGPTFWGGKAPEENEPSGEADSCVAMNSEDFMHFHEFSCSQKYGVVCQRDCACACPWPYISLAGGCFQFLNVGVNATDAKIICQSSGGDLAVIDNCHVLLTFIEHLDTEGPWSNLWIGGAKVGSSYEWRDGTRMKLGEPFWSSNKIGNMQPDDYLGAEDCVHLRDINNFYFNDISCSNVYAPLCEAPHVS